MADDEHEDEQQDEASDDAEGLDELTPEQQEKLLKTLAQLGRPRIPNIDVKPPYLVQIPTANVIRGWQKRFSVINSDIFKVNVLSLYQPNLNLIASQLTRTIDFGLSKTVSRFATQFAEQQVAWLKTIQPEDIEPSDYPRNLQDIEDLEFEEVEEVVMVDGIALYGVPRTSTAEALIRADSAKRRRVILGQRWKTISTDCRDVVTACTTADVADYVPIALAALDALDAGHTKAAQALTASLIDDILTSYFKKIKKNRRRFTPHAKGNRTNDAYNEFTPRQFIAVAPKWQTYQKFDADERDGVPRTFSRNATAHTVHRRQYSLRNAVQGLMFACGLVCFLDEEAAAAEAA